ncbi:MAG: hypothetical protein JRJ35_14975 [Deltaproteobacteria bacterium]|nr:hypothetical protein [Deltaproteobacteria bacterium]
MISKRTELTTESGRSPSLPFASDLISGLSKDTPRVDRTQLINKINFLHFMGESLGVLIHHPASQDRVLLRAMPGPCAGEEVSCRWTAPLPAGGFPPTLRFLYLMLDSGKSMILVPAEIFEFRNDGFSVTLPKTGFVVSHRAVIRYPGSNVEVELSQNGFRAHGRIADFSVLSCRVRLNAEACHALHAFDPRKALAVRMGSGDEACFEGTCRCLRQQGDPKSREIVLAFEEPNRKVFAESPARNPRQRLVPCATVTFTHPLLKKKMEMEVFDISTAGFSILEMDDQGMLFPGLVIPNLRINGDGGSALRCMAQVIYSRRESERERRSGLAIVDIDMESYTRLAQRLVRVMDPYFNISGRLDLREMWDLLFSSGIIPPQSYERLGNHLQALKKTYQKIYADRPQVVRHFTYQKNGRIYAHMAMVHAYPRAWMLHHHAARGHEEGGAALEVLKEVVYFLNDMRRFRFANLDYTICYFQPQNALADQVFGRFARSLKNPRACSMDLFSYHLFQTTEASTGLGKGWSLRKSTKKDLTLLEKTYEERSGGLMLEALGLPRALPEAATLAATYAQNGLIREMEVYSLKQGRDPKAILLLNRSDLGLDLSDLLNGVKVWVLDPHTLSWDMVCSAAAKLLRSRKIQEAPVLCYPMDWVEAQEAPYERQYLFWALGSRPGHEGGDAFMDFMKRKFKLSLE